MKEEIAKIAEKIIHDAQDDYAVDKKHMPSQQTRAHELADAILALEVEGKTKCSLAPCCPDGRQPDPDKCRDCNLDKPATIKDLISD